MSSAARRLGASKRSAISPFVTSCPLRSRAVKASGAKPSKALLISPGAISPPSGARVLDRDTQRAAVGVA